MMSKKTTIPLLNKETTEPQKNESACSSCSSGGCCGGFGIKAGSEKDVVFRNIFLYVAMGLIIFTVAYIVTRIMAWATA